MSLTENNTRMLKSRKISAEQIIGKLHSIKSTILIALKNVEAEIRTCVLVLSPRINHRPGHMLYFCLFTHLVSERHGKTCSFFKRRHY